LRILIGTQVRSIDFAMNRSALALTGKVYSQNSGANQAKNPAIA